MFIFWNVSKVAKLFFPAEDRGELLRQGERHPPGGGQDRFVHSRRMGQGQSHLLLREFS